MTRSSRSSRRCGRSWPGCSPQDSRASRATPSRHAPAPTDIPKPFLYNASEMSEFRPNRDALVAPGQIDHHVGDMTATVAADVPLRQVQWTLAAANQWL